MDRACYFFLILNKQQDCLVGEKLYSYSSYYVIPFHPCSYFPFLKYFKFHLRMTVTVENLLRSLLPSLGSLLPFYCLENQEPATFSISCTVLTLFPSFNQNSTSPKTKIEREYYNKSGYIIKASKNLNYSINFSHLASTSVLCFQ